METVAEQLINMGWILTKWVTIPIVIGWIIIKLVRRK